MLSTHSFRSLLLVLAVFLGVHGIAQNFSGFSYQAVVRDNVGDPVPTQLVGVQVTIQVGPTDTYVETHSATTDAYGLIALTIGQGTPVGGSAIPAFADVQWASGLPITYTVAVDVTGGTNYTFLSGGPFKAVPFAMHALTSDSSTTSAPQTLTLSNDTLYITGGNGVDLSGLAGTPGWVLSGDTLHNDSKRVGIGTTAPGTDLHVVGGITYQDGNQGAAKLLTSDADGNASWQNLGAASIFGNGNVPPPNFSCLANVGSAATGAGPYSMAVAGNTAYVVNYNSNTLQVFNVSNPAAPSITGSIVTGSGPFSVAVAGNYAYVVNYNGNTLQVFNVSNPAAPNLTGSIATESVPRSVAVAGNMAYVVNYHGNTLQVFNVSNPAAPSLSGSIATGSNPVSVAVAGNTAYVVNLNNTLQVFNVSNPAAPSLSGSIATGSDPRSVAVAGNYAYVVNYNGNTLQVFNVSNPAAPSLAGSIATGAGPFSVTVAGNTAYVVNADSNTLQVFNGFCPQTVGVDPGTGSLTSTTSAWNTFGSNIANTNSGSVGIGTTTPASKLDVEGGLAVGATYSGTTTAPANGAIIEGSVGIGTTTATDKLTVRTATSNYGLTHTDGTITVGSFVGGSAGGGWLGTKSNHNLNFFTNDSPPKMTLTTEGKLGIGTTTPQAALHVNGNVQLDHRLLFNSDNNQIHWGPGALYFNMLTISGDHYSAVGRIAIAENGNVGIGIGAQPQHKLSVRTGTSEFGLTHTDGTVTVGSYVGGGGVGGGWFGTKSNHALNFFTNNSSAQVTLLTNGNMGIGTTTPAQRLSVTGNICYTGTIGACSDRRYKTDFTPLSGSLAKVGLLQGLYYNWRTEEFPDKEFPAERQLGFIAQDIEALFPEVVLTDAQGYKSVDYGRLTPVLVEAIKELNALVQQQQATISDQHTTLNTLRTQLDANTALMLKLQSVLDAQTRK